MSLPFAGLRVIDTIHVLAEPFAAYRLAVLGADVIKVESPEEPDQARAQGSDRRLSATRGPSGPALSHHRRKRGGAHAAPHPPDALRHMGPAGCREPLAGCSA